jgi:hypothetical protein
VTDAYRLLSLLLMLLLLLLLLCVCECVCVYSYVCSCVCTALDLEQRYSNEREKYFTEEQRETVQNLRKIKAAAENKGILRISSIPLLCVCVSVG